MTAARTVATTIQRLLGPWMVACSASPARMVLKNVEAGVLQIGEQPDQQRADVAELWSRLDHLREAQLRSLRAVEGHEECPDQRARDDGDQRPDEVAPADHREGPHRERGDLSVAHEPQGPLAPDLAMPFGERHVGDRADLDLAEPGSTTAGGISCHGNSRSS